MQDAVYIDFYLLIFQISVSLFMFLNFRIHHESQLRKNPGLDKNILEY